MRRERSLIETKAPMRSGAVIVGPYRYRLWREWNADRPGVTLVMLNPSRADAKADDPTIRRCIGFAQAWAYGSLEVVNLFAFRTPFPSALCQIADPIGPENDVVLREAATRASCVVLAWGNAGGYLDRDRAVTELLRAAPCALHCLGMTRRGSPRHPLYLSRQTQLQDFLQT